jgi:hypothetical protein
VINVGYCKINTCCIVPYLIGGYSFRQLTEEKVVSFGCIMENHSRNLRTGFCAREIINGNPLKYR